MASKPTSKAKETSVQRLVRESEAIAMRSKPRPGKPAARVRVLVESVYVGPNHKSVGIKKVGEEFDTAAGPYADSLVKGGWVELVNS